MKKYLFIILLVQVCFGQIKILKMETQHKTLYKGELKSIVGNTILYQNSTQFFKKGKIDSINIATINKIIFSPLSLSSLQSSILDFLVVTGGSFSAFIEGWYGYKFIFGTATNTIVLTTITIYYRLALLKKNTLKMDAWDNSGKILELEKLLFK